MNIEVLRDQIDSVCTGSRVSVDGVFECYGLEPPVLDGDVKPRAIPEGTYHISIRFSSKHGRDVPHVENVPGFEEIEIHPGNFPKDTEGCLLVGNVRSVDFVGDSRKAFEALFAKIKAASAVSITYKSNP